MESFVNFFQSKFYVYLFDIVLLGINVTAAGSSFTWSYAMRVHFYEFLVGIILSTIMYACLVLCIAEMMSALPFSGGVYGLARVALNPYIGFLIGILESFKNIFHLACCVQSLSRFAATCLNDDMKYQPVYWLIILGSVSCICIIGGRFFWYFNRSIGLLCLIIIIMFLCTPMVNHANFNDYANTNLNYETIHSFDVNGMFQFMFLGSWFYIGIELLPFTCIDTKQATKTIPLAILITFIIVMIFAFGVYFSACSQYPGATYLQYSHLPMVFGFSKMLNMKNNSAAWLSIACIFASVFSYVFGCGRQIGSLSSSKLLPVWLQWKTKGTETSYMAILTTSLLTFLTLIVLRYKLHNDITILFYICILNSFFSYWFMFLTYVRFKRKYMTLKREFTNPLGIPSAYLGAILTLMIIGAMIGLNPHRIVAAPITVAIIIVIASMYYMIFVSKHQYYSEEEQKAFLLTYVINANAHGRKKHKKHIYNNTTTNNTTDNTSFASRLWFFPVISSYLNNLMITNRSMSLSSSARKYFLQTMTNKPIHKHTLKKSVHLNSYHHNNTVNNKSISITQTNLTETQRNNNSDNNMEECFEPQENTENFDDIENADNNELNDISYLQDHLEIDREIQQSEECFSPINIDFNQLPSLQELQSLSNKYQSINELNLQNNLVLSTTTTTSANIFSYKYNHKQILPEDMLTNN